MPVSHFIANSTSTFGHFKDKMNVLIDTFNGLNVPAGTLVTTTGPQNVNNKIMANTSVTGTFSGNLTNVTGLTTTSTVVSTTIRNNLNAAVIDPADISSVQPTLDFDFTEITGASFYGNLVRSTPGGCRTNRKGILVPTVANEPVIDVGLNGEAKGTGFYGAYTNLLVRSEEFDHASWGKSGLTGVTANASSGPDGATTMDKLTEDTSTAVHYIRQTVTVVSGSPITGSVFLKAAERTKGEFQIWGGGGGITVNIDLIAKTVSASPYGGWTSSSAAIEELPGGIFRCSGTATPNTTTVNYQISTQNAAGATSYTGDGVSGLYVWGTQLTQTSYPVPYVPTTSATVVRNADSMVISGTDFTDFYNPTEGTIHLEGTLTGEPSIQNLIFLFDGTSNNTIGLRQGSLIAGLDLFVASGGVSQVDTLSANIRQGNSFKIAAKFAKNNFELVVNGVSIGTDLSGTIPTGINQMSISASTGGAFNLTRIIYWPKALTSTELQRITA